MTTSHLCNGTWKPGSNEECPKHKRLSRKQISVFRSGDKAPGSGGGSSGGGGSKSG